MGEIRPLDNWKTGAAIGTMAAMASFQPGLMPRPALHQAGGTAVSTALGFGVGIAGNAIANKLDSSTDLSPLQSRAAVAGAGALGVAATSLALRGRPSQMLELARTASGLLALTAITGSALIGEQKLVDKYGEGFPGGSGAMHAAVLGTAAIGAGALILGKPRASAVSAEAAEAYAKAHQPYVASSNVLDTAAAERITKWRAANNGQLLHTSGAAAESALPRELLDKRGLRFVDERLPREEIARVLGKDVSAVTDPKRLYAGLKHGATPAERADLLLTEAISVNAFDRSRIVLYTPSGTGHVNPTSVASMEYLTGGDVVGVGMQYSNKPSVLSLHKIDDGRDLFDQVLSRFSQHIKTLPEVNDHS